MDHIQITSASAEEGGDVNDDNNNNCSPVAASVQCNGTNSDTNNTTSCTTSGRSRRNTKCTSSIWDHYRSFVHRHHVSLELLEAGVSRILFWTPTTQQRHRQKREVLYGILSLHRLAMDTALQQQQQQQQSEDDKGRIIITGLPRDFGMTVRPNTNNNDNDSLFRRISSPTTLRIAITVIQSLLPSLLELSQSSSSSSSSSHHSSFQQDNNWKRRARVRLYVERAKFALRLVLLGSYWRQLIRQDKEKRQFLLEQQGEPPSLIPPLAIGLMADGGLFRNGIINYGEEETAPTTVAQEDALWRRRNYVGRRTGRTVVRRRQTQPPNNNGGPVPVIHDVYYASSSSSQPAPVQTRNNNHLRRIFSVMLGEVLYTYRPLYWANAEASGPASYRSWIVSFAMDFLSLQLCCANKNVATRTELSRRKMRLLLYLLRTPVWDRWTEPIMSDQVETLLEKVPLVGRLASTYIRDWLWYMQHPYVAEEG